MNQKSSITGNAIFNVIKTAVSVIVPLITYSYVARILGADNMGKIGFSNSVISYFQLIASLGITNYAIAEGAKLRGNNVQLSIFSSEVLCINLLSTGVAYLLLIIAIMVIPLLKNYTDLLLISSVSMFFTMLGMDWIYGATEQYKYISIRSVFFQVVSLILILCFIKKRDQSALYMMIYILPIVCTGVVNYIYRRKFVSISFKEVQLSNIKRHLKPILMIWGMSVASVIYINSDTIMLVALKGNNIAGLYSTAIKASHVCCLMMAAISTVLMPRISVFVAERKYQEFNELFNKTINAMFLLIIPMCVGLFVMNKETVLLLGGSEYANASVAARIISFNVIFSPLNGLIASQIFIPFGRQKVSLIATITGALLNVILNFLLIPNLSLNGAAITTIISEITVMVICLASSKDLLLISLNKKNICQFIMASTPIPIVYLCVESIIKVNILLGSFLCVFISGIIYLLILALLNNETFKFYLSIINRMRRRIVR